MSPVGRFVPVACEPRVKMACPLMFVLVRVCVLRAMLMLVVSALSAMSGMIAMFCALWPCRARACDATWGDVGCMP